MCSEKKEKNQVGDSLAELTSLSSPFTRGFSDDPEDNARCRDDLRGASREQPRRVRILRGLGDDEEEETKKYSRFVRRDHIIIIIVVVIAIIVVSRSRPLKSKRAGEQRGGRFSKMAREKGSSEGGYFVWVPSRSSSGRRAVDERSGGEEETKSRRRRKRRRR